MNQKQYKSKWYIKNRERIKREKAIVYLENKSEIQVQHARYYLNNKERINVRNAKYRTENKIHIDEKIKAWREANPDRVRAMNTKYEQTPKGKHLRKAATEKRRRKVNYTPGAIEYIQILENDPCCYCGEPTQAIDHIDAVNAGGASDWDNLTATCKKCNSRKSIKSLLRFLNESADRSGFGR